ncbi:MAG: PAS domain S-box protein [Syntrophobacteraceae bacterium]|nr:PAS domain S-box protein [Syntrophobacteraceae bacterium]
MQDDTKTKRQLLTELSQLRSQVAELQKNQGASTDSGELRRRAEEWLETTRAETGQRESHDTARLCHELQVQQVELGMQNEELRNALVQIEESRQRYSDLYEFAPVGYLTLGEKGTVLETNLTAAVQLGIERSGLIKRPFQGYVMPADRDKFRSHLNEVFTSGKRQSCEIGLTTKSGGDFYALLDTVFMVDSSGKKLCRTTVTDITERKRTENLVNVRLRLVEFAASHSAEEVLQKTLDEIGQFTKSPVGFLHFVEMDQKNLSLQAWSTRTLKEFCSAEGKGAHYPIDKAGVWVDCFHEKGPVVHNDYFALPYRKGLPDGHPPVFRELCVPIMRSDRVVAILGIGNKPEDYTQQDIAVASYLADVAWEITRRKLAEEELRKTYEKLNTTLESITDGFFSVDRDWRITYVTKAGAEMLGMKREDLVGGYLRKVFPRAVKLAFYPRFRHVIESNSAVHFEEYYPNPLNKWWECHAYPSAEGMSVYFRDITEHKLIEETRAFLAQSGRILSSDEDFFKSLARYLGKSLGMDYVCIDRLEGDCLSARTLAVYFDGKFEDNVTYTLKDTPCGEVVEKKVCCVPKDVCHLFPRDEVLREMKAESYVGTILWGSKGQPIGLIAVIGRQPLANRNLAESVLQLVAVRAAGELERKWIEEELRESRSRLDLAVRSAHMGVWKLDLIENKRHFDDQVCHLLGIARDKFTGTEEEFYKALHPDDREMVKAIWARTIEQDRPYEAEYRAVWPDGSVHYVSARGKLVYDDKDKPVMVNGLIWDTTDRKQMEKELRRSRNELELRVNERTAELRAAVAKLEQLNEELQEFAFIASHDLQEPLRKIQTFGNMLIKKHKEALNPEGQDYMERITKAANRMSELLRALLKYSRTGTSQLDVRPVSLTEVAREASNDLELLINRVEGRIEIGELPTVEADATLLRQLFQNIIENSIKYRKESEPPVVKIYGQISDSVCQIFIEDNGIGFEEEFTHKIFKPFERLHGMNSLYKGTGMGLAICQKILERHGGAITARSIPGKGSIFVVTLPAKRQA